jgi:PAS domain S-box-containing protein
MTQSERDPSDPAAAMPGDPTDTLQRAIIDSLYDQVYYLDRGRRIRYSNQRAECLTGLEASAVVGQFCYQDLLNHVDDTGRRLFCSGSPLAATMGDGEPREAEVFLRHDEGHRVPVRVRTTPVRDRKARSSAPSRSSTTAPSSWPPGARSRSCATSRCATP